MPTIVTTNLRFFANPTCPFVAADRLVALLACFYAFETPGIHIFSPAKQATKEGNLFFLRRLIGNRQLTIVLTQFFCRLELGRLFSP